MLVLGGLAVVQFGLMPTNADARPPSLERRIATSALDASLNRRAPRLSNPVASNDDNLIEGMKIYTMNCSVCHGTLDNQPSPLEHSFYPPVPQLVLNPVDDPEWHTYEVVRNGIRYPVCRPGGIRSASKTRGRLQTSSPGLRLCLRQCRTIGVSPTAWLRPAQRLSPINPDECASAV